MIQHQRVALVVPLEAHVHTFHPRQLMDNTAVIPNRRTASVRRMNGAQSRRSAMAFAALVAALHFSAPAALQAQVLYGSLTGTVADASKAPVPDATVLALNSGTGEIREAGTNAQGLYLF